MLASFVCISRELSELYCLQSGLNSVNSFVKKLSESATELSSLYFAQIMKLVTACNVMQFIYFNVTAFVCVSHRIVCVSV